MGSKIYPVSVKPEDEAKFIKRFIEAGGSKYDIEGLTGIDMRKFAVRVIKYEYGGIDVTVTNILDKVLKEWDVE